MKKITVILSGCGHRDGSEIREAVATLWAISQAGAEAICYAPDAPQTTVVNLYTGKGATNETRNQLTEAARIARGKIKPLTQFDAANCDAVILPGGFGAALNLSNFATQGSKGSVIPEVNKVLKHAREKQLPIGAICIAPAVLALALRGQSLQLTVGQPCEASQEIEKLGHRHVVCPANDCVTDHINKVVTTPAYMYDDAPLHEIFLGIQKLVQKVLALTA